MICFYSATETHVQIYKMFTIRAQENTNSMDWKEQMNTGIKSISNLFSLRPCRHEVQTISWQTSWV